MHDIVNIPPCLSNTSMNVQVDVHSQWNVTDYTLLSSACRTAVVLMTVKQSETLQCSLSLLRLFIFYAVLLLFCLLKQFISVIQYIVSFYKCIVSVVYGKIFQEI